MGFSRGTRSGDSVLMSGGEGEHYDRGFDNGFWEEFSAKRPDGSRLLLTERSVWGRSEDPAAVRASRQAVREAFRDGADAGADVDTGVPAVGAPESAGHADWARYNRLAESLTDRIADKVCSSFSDGEAGFLKFLRNGSNFFTLESRRNIVINGVVNGLDISTYKYDLQYIPSMGHFSGGFPVDHEQYDAMMKRVEWIRMLEDAVSKRVSLKLEQRFGDRVDFACLGLKVSILENGDCGLRVLPKRGGEIKEVFLG